MSFDKNEEEVWNDLGTLLQFPVINIISSLCRPKICSESYQEINHFTITSKQIMLIVPFKFQPYHSMSEQDGRDIENSQFLYSKHLEIHPLQIKVGLSTGWTTFFLMVGVYFTMKYQATPYWKDGRMYSKNEVGKWCKRTARESLILCAIRIIDID